jgi:hypothetical protein
MTSNSDTPRVVRAVDRIASRQLAMVTSTQLDEIGFGRGTREKWLATGQLKRMRRGVYMLPGVAPTWDASVLAAVLAAGPQAVVSHLTAAHLWQLFDGPPPETVRPCIHITAPWRHHLAGVKLHRRRLDDREQTRYRSIPVTTPARTLFDLATMLDADQLGRCVDEALRRRLLTVSELGRLLQQHAGAGRRRLRPLRAVLAQRLAGFDPGANEWEQRMDRQWKQLGLPASRRQYWVNVAGGRCRVDRAVPELKLAVEWVGKAYHSLDGRYARDRMRISDLVQAGWDVIEVTPEWSPNRIYATVMAKVAERRQLFLGCAVDP